MNSYEAIANVEIWSEAEFGNASLKHKSRVERLVVMAAGAANRPAGRITEVFKTSADREGAYKFLENPKFEAETISLASHVACAERCAEELSVFVPVDGSSLSLADPKKTKEGLGSVGNRSKNGRGLEVMNAIAVTKEGIPLGLTGQAFWARPEKKNPIPSKKRNIEDKETRFWFTAINQTLDAFIRANSRTIPWFQLDRGGDFREMLGWAAHSSVWLTVRAAQNRRVFESDEAYLWDSVTAADIIGTYTLSVSAGPKRKERQAQMEVKLCPVTIRVPNPWTHQEEEVTLYAVQTREVGTTPKGEKPIEWLLLTNYPVTSFDEACLVIFGYSQRWKVEEFHKTWKSVCNIEDTLLEEASRVKKWAVILAAVAMRIERLKYLSRHFPEKPATEELTRNEIDATIILREPAGYQVGDTPTIFQAVRWIADLGGYTGKSSGGPPGSIVIGRGLKEIAMLSRVLIKSEFKQRKMIKKK